MKVKTEEKIVWIGNVWKNKNKSIKNDLKTRYGFFKLAPVTNVVRNNKMKCLTNGSSEAMNCELLCTTKQHFLLTSSLFHYVLSKIEFLSSSSCVTNKTNFIFPPWQYFFSVPFLPHIRTYFPIYLFKLSLLFFRCVLKYANGK